MDRFSEGLKFVLKHEGGYVNDPQDAGGETKNGISRRFLDGLTQDSLSNKPIKELTDENIAYLYKRYFWDEGNYDKLQSDVMAIKAFDVGVNLGRYWSIKLLQKSFNELYPKRAIDVDGLLGRNTFNSINIIAEDVIYYAYINQIVKYYRDLAANNFPDQRFLNGWLARANDKPELGSTDPVS